MVDSAKNKHWIRQDCGDLQVDDDGRSVAEIKNFIMSLDPDGVKTASAAYHSASAMLAATLDTIDDVSAELAKIWEGNASVRTQKALRLLHLTIRNLCDGLDRMEGPLDTLGDTLRDHQDFVKNTRGSWSNPVFDPLGSINDSSGGIYKTIDSGWEPGSQDQLAGRHLRALNNDLARIYPRFPDFVEKELPRINDQAGPALDLTQVDLPSGRSLLQSWPSLPQAEYPSGMPTGADLDLGDPPRLHLPDGPNPSDDHASNPTSRDPDWPRDDGGDSTTGRGRDGGVTGRSPADLADTPTSPGRGIDPADSSALGYEDSTRLSLFNPSDIGTSPTLITNPHGVPAPHTGPYGGPPNAGGTFGGLAAPLPQTTSTRGWPPPMPMPGAGAGRGGGDEERTHERSTWLVEDDLVWTGEQEGTVPDVLH